MGMGDPRGLLSRDLGGLRGRDPTNLHLLPNPTSGGQDGAGLWWPIRGLQGPGWLVSVTSWLGRHPVAFPSCVEREVQFTVLKGAALTFLPSRGS